jgi:hypothetical protein
MAADDGNYYDYNLNFDGATLVSTPATDLLKNKGVKFDSGKARLHLVPEEAILGTAEAMGYGADKYAAFNYKKGLKYTRLTDSLRRHLLAFLQGEDNDPESGLSHTKHILANAAMLEYMRAKRPDMDDRYKDDSDMD